MITVLPALQELRKRHMSAAGVSKNDCVNHAKATLHANIDHAVLAQLKEKQRFTYIHTYIHDFILSRIYRVAKKLISSRKEKERKI